MTRTRSNSANDYFVVSCQKIEIARMESLANDGQDTTDEAKKRYRSSSVRLSECATTARISEVKKRRKERDEKKNI